MSRPALPQYPGHRASEDPTLSMDLDFVDMPAFYSEGDTVRAAGIMADQGVDCLVTLGGDGTNRAAVVGSRDIPMVAISTGTNNVFPTLTVHENLEMGAYIRKDDFRPRLLEIYEMFPPLAEKKKQAAGELSGGQRQMVAMGKALMLEPTILMLDEPTAGLSPIYRNEIFQIIRQINASGVPILMVEQNAKQSLAIANRGYVFVDGRNRTTGKGIDLLNDPEIAKMFLGG